MKTANVHVFQLLTDKQGRRHTYGSLRQEDSHEAYEQPVDPLPPAPFPSENRALPEKLMDTRSTLFVLHFYSIELERIAILDIKKW